MPPRRSKRVKSGEDAPAVDPQPEAGADFTPCSRHGCPNPARTNSSYCSDLCTVLHIGGGQPAAQASTSAPVTPVAPTVSEIAPLEEKEQQMEEKKDPAVPDTIPEPEVEGDPSPVALLTPFMSTLRNELGLAPSPDAKPSDELPEVYRGLLVFGKGNRAEKVPIVARAPAVSGLSKDTSTAMIRAYVTGTLLPSPTLTISGRAEYQQMASHLIDVLQKSKSKMVSILTLTADNDATLATDQADATQAFQSFCQHMVSRSRSYVTQVASANTVVYFVARSDETSKYLLQTEALLALVVHPKPKPPKSRVPSAEVEEEDASRKSKSKSRRKGKSRKEKREARPALGDEPQLRSSEPAPMVTESDAQTPQPVAAGPSMSQIDPETNAPQAAGLDSAAASPGSRGFFASDTVVTENETLAIDPPAPEAPPVSDPQLLGPQGGDQMESVRSETQPEQNVTQPLPPHGPEPPSSFERMDTDRRSPSPSRRSSPSRRRDRSRDRDRGRDRDRDRRDRDDYRRGDRDDYRRDTKRRDSPERRNGGRDRRDRREDRRDAVRNFRAWGRAGPPPARVARARRGDGSPSRSPSRSPSPSPPPPSPKKSNFDKVLPTPDNIPPVRPEDDNGPVHLKALPTGQKYLDVDDQVEGIVFPVSAEPDPMKPPLPAKKPVDGLGGSALKLLAQKKRMKEAKPVDAMQIDTSPADSSASAPAPPLPPLAQTQPSVPAPAASVPTPAPPQDATEVAPPVAAPSTGEAVAADPPQATEQPETVAEAQEPQDIHASFIAKALGESTGTATPPADPVAAPTAPSAATTPAPAAPPSTTPATATPTAPTPAAPTDMAGLKLDRNNPKYMIFNLPAQHVTKIYVHGADEFPAGFDAVTALCGWQGQNFDYVGRQSGAKVLLGGRGSGDSETENEPLHVMVLALTNTALRKARQLAEELILAVKGQAQQHVAAPPVVAEPVAAPGVPGVEAPMQDPSVAAYYQATYGQYADQWRAYYEQYYGAGYMPPGAGAVPAEAPAAAPTAASATPAAPGVDVAPPGIEQPVPAESATPSAPMAPPQAAVGSEDNKPLQFGVEFEAPAKPDAVPPATEKLPEDGGDGKGEKDDAEGMDPAVAAEIRRWREQAQGIDEERERQREREAAALVMEHTGIGVDQPDLPPPDTTQPPPPPAPEADSRPLQPDHREDAAKGPAPPLPPGPDPAQGSGWEREPPIGDGPQGQPMDRQPQSFDARRGRSRSPGGPGPAYWPSSSGRGRSPPSNAYPSSERNRRPSPPREGGQAAMHRDQYPPDARASGAMERDRHGPPARFQRRSQSPSGGAAGRRRSPSPPRGSYRRDRGPMEPVDRRDAGAPPPRLDERQPPPPETADRRSRSGEPDRASCTLAVDNLPPDTSENEVGDLFSNAGYPVRAVLLQREAAAGGAAPRTGALLRFYQQAVAGKAISHFHRSRFGGYELSVQWSRSDGEVIPGGAAAQPRRQSDFEMEAGEVPEEARHRGEGPKRPLAADVAQGAAPQQAAPKRMRVGGVADSDGKKEKGHSHHRHARQRKNGKRSRGDSVSSTASTGSSASSYSSYSSSSDGSQCSCASCRRDGRGKFKGQTAVPPLAGPARPEDGRDAPQPFSEREGPREMRPASGGYQRSRSRSPPGYSRRAGSPPLRGDEYRRPRSPAEYRPRSRSPARRSRSRSRSRSPPYGRGRGSMGYGRSPPPHGGPMRLPPPDDDWLDKAEHAFDVNKHPPSDELTPRRHYKLRACLGHGSEQGCRNGRYCTYAHGRDELEFWRDQTGIWFDHRNPRRRGSMYNSSEGQYEH